MPTLIGKVSTLQKVYNPDTMSWDAMRQPSTGGGGGSTVVPSTQVAVSNFPATQTIAGTVSVSGYVAPSTTVSVANTVAVSGPLTDTQLRATAVPVSVSGYVAPSTTVSIANTVAVTGGGSTQVSIREFLSSSGGSLVDSSRVSLRVTVTEQPAGGSTQVSVSNFPASQAVTGTFWQATQPVSGPLTNAELRAAPIEVTGAGGSSKVSAWLFDSTGLSLESSTRANAASTMRGLAVRSIMPDCTNASGFSSVAGDLTLLTSNAYAIYVYGFTVTKYSSVVNVLRFLNGSTALAYYVSASGINGGGTGSTGIPAGGGHTMMVPPPAYLFKTSTGNPLILSRTSSGHFSYGVHAWREG